MKKTSTWSYNFNQLEFSDDDEDEVYLKDKDRIMEEKLFNFLESEDYYLTSPDNKKDDYYQKSLMKLNNLNLLETESDNDSISYPELISTDRDLNTLQGKS